jgi:hypothetical protein
MKGKLKIGVASERKKHTIENSISFYVAIEQRAAALYTYSSLPLISTSFPNFLMLSMSVLNGYRPLRAHGP